MLWVDLSKSGVMYFKRYLGFMPDDLPDIYFVYVYISFDLRDDQEGCECFFAITNRPQ